MSKQYENEIEQFTVDGITAFIFTDPHPENPREMWDNAGTMVCFHSRHNLGDKHDFPTPEAFRLWWEQYGDGGTLLPLYLYDHSGQTISTTPFSCPWDSGQVGWIYMTAKRAEQEGITDPVSYLRGEVATYDRYVRGEVYGFAVHDTDEELLDSCCGFYELGHCREEARHTAEGYANAGDPWVVLYRDDGVNPINPPLAFQCRADDGDHAEEQCRNAYPQCEILWTYLGDVEEAFKDYWGGIDG